MLPAAPARPFALEALLRPSVRALKPYALPREALGAHVHTLMDLSENPYDGELGGYNRYPDRMAARLRAKLAELRGVSAEQVLVSNGSDEAIDLLLRLFCVPGQDAVAILPPTFGMYEVSAALNDVAVVRHPLDARFGFSAGALLASLPPAVKLIFFCHPNNPTANLMALPELRAALEAFGGIVVVDEAYIEFAPGASVLPWLAAHPNLVVLQTLSKAWGLAGLRVGATYASAEIISWLMRIKPPFNVSGPAQAMALAALNEPARMQAHAAALLSERDELAAALAALPAVAQVHPSDANFLLVRFANAAAAFAALLAAGILVSDRSAVPGLAGCLRISVGTPEQNRALVAALAGLSLSL